jgi:hypothetical protein
MVSMKAGRSVDHLAPTKADKLAAEKAVLKADL